MSIKLKLKNLLINLTISLISIILTLVLIEFAFRKFVFNYYRTPKGNEILLSYGLKESSIPGVPYEFIPNYGDENSNWMRTVTGTLIVLDSEGRRLKFRSHQTYIE
jgi:hypothetical protein